jgi:hypothetical protein
MNQVTLRVRSQSELTEKNKYERAEGNVGMAMQQKGQKAEGHVTVTGGQKAKANG